MPSNPMQSKFKTHSRLRMLKLEQRILFDGAAAAEVVKAADASNTAPEIAEVAKPATDQTPVTNTPEANKPAATTDSVDTAPVETPTFFTNQASATSDELQSAFALAEKAVRDYIATTPAETLFATFNGAQTQASEAWLAAAESLRQDILAGRYSVEVQSVSNEVLHGALGAFAAKGPDGSPVIYLNQDWMNNVADAPEIARVLIEELGHSLDARLNPAGDTAGDEGWHFARTVFGETFDSQSPSFGNDQDTLLIDGKEIHVELANYNFVNAYSMVYDLDNDTFGKAPNAITTADIDTTERWADKEQNSHYFNTAGLRVAFIDDNTNSNLFSGNDVSAIGINIGGQEYFGWISRPIKSGGIVRGFYFWTDNTFTNLATAQADGNTDGDRSVLDNKGFLLVVDQAWFDQQITTPTSYSINNAKDGNLGTISVANVGSSSDRVDAALNSLLVPNSAPTPANDALTVAEDSGATTVTAINGLLKNDTDPDLDALTVTAFFVGGVNTTVDPSTGGSYSITNVGTITISKDGSYTFTPVANYSGPVSPITYTVSDGKGGSASAVLSISVTPVNDAPAGTDKTITARENFGYTFTAADFGFTDPTDSPANMLAGVKITTVPGSGTLSLNGATVTAGQEIAAADLTKLRYVPLAHQNGTGIASFTFQVRDNGGTANGGVDTDQSPNIITINVTNVNSAPTTVTDTATASEAGGVNNAAAGSNATGNVLTNDTDPDSGDTKVLVSATGAGGTTGTGPFTVVGLYGTLTIATDGSYTMVLKNSLI